MARFYLTASIKQATFDFQSLDVDDVLTFWRQSARFWFEKNSAFDTFFRNRFCRLHKQIMEGRHDDWLVDPNSALALILMTDQYPRSAFRGTVDMYSADALAIHYARIALRAGYLDQVEDRLKLFFILPFAHSEDLADQRISVAFIEQLGQPWLSRARHHMEIISQFGRFPHRNEMLGRASTQEEMAFLQMRPASDGLGPPTPRNTIS